MPYIGTVAAALVLTPASVFAQGAAEPGQQGPQAQQAQQGEPQQLTEAEATERAAQQGLIRLANTMDATVRDQDGNKLATVQDVGLDTAHQQAAFAVISSGGFLGLGDKQVCVPFSALEAAPGQEGLRATFNKEAIDQAPEFAEEDWASLSDQQKAEQIYQQFGTEPYWTGEAAGQGEQAGQAGEGAIEAEAREQAEQAAEGDLQQPEAEQPAGEAGQQVAGEAGQGADEAEQAMDQLQVVRASELIDQPITAAAAGGAQQPAQPEQQIEEGAGQQAEQQAQDTEQGQGEELGQLADLIVDMREGKLIYAIINRPDAAAEGQYAAVPFSALRYSQDEQQFTLDAEAQTLEQLAFGQDNWPDMTSEQWGSSVHQQFDQQPYWQVFGYASPGQGQGQGEQQETGQQQDPQQETGDQQDWEQEGEDTGQQQEGDY
jgi:sporulation protein YlmC with PRC-barrel domain